MNHHPESPLVVMTPHHIYLYYLVEERNPLRAKFIDMRKVQQAQNE
jgi:hypothetical protein